MPHMSGNYPNFSPILNLPIFSPFFPILKSCLLFGRFLPLFAESFSDTDNGGLEPPIESNSYGLGRLRSSLLSTFFCWKLWWNGTGTLMLTCSDLMGGSDRPGFLFHVGKYCKLVVFFSSMSNFYRTFPYIKCFAVPVLTIDLKWMKIEGSHLSKYTGTWFLKQSE